MGYLGMSVLLSGLAAGAGVAFYLWVNKPVRVHTIDELLSHVGEEYPILKMWETHDGVYRTEFRLERQTDVDVVLTLTEQERTLDHTRSIIRTLQDLTDLREGSPYGRT